MKLHGDPVSGVASRSSFARLRMATLAGMFKIHVESSSAGGPFIVSLYENKTVGRYAKKQLESMALTDVLFDTAQNIWYW